MTSVVSLLVIMSRSGRRKTLEYDKIVVKLRLDQGVNMSRFQEYTQGGSVLLPAAFERQILLEILKYK